MSILFLASSLPSKRAFKTNKCKLYTNSRTGIKSSLFIQALSNLSSEFVVFPNAETTITRSEDSDETIFARFMIPAGSFTEAPPNL